MSAQISAETFNVQTCHLQKLNKQIDNAEATVDEIEEDGHTHTGEIGKRQEVCIQAVHESMSRIAMRRDNVKESKESKWVKR